MFEIYTYEIFKNLVGDKLVATVQSEHEAMELLKTHNCWDYAVSDSVTLRKFNGRIFREET